MSFCFLIKKNAFLSLIWVITGSYTYGQSGSSPAPIKLSEIKITAASTRSDENKMDVLSMQLQPVKSAQDLLRIVPGLFIAQHAGGGKAEQIFVRGNDNDHGTDFGVFFDDIPVNMPSHAHGQGYADMHFMIPELLGKASFYKGPYEAKLGDFSISGAAFFNSKYKLDNNLAKIEYGRFNNQRALIMYRLLDKKHLVKKWEDNAYFAGDYTYSDGFFLNKLDFSRINLFGRYNARLNANNLLVFTASAFSSNWNASGQLPLRAVEAGLSPYGSIDPTEGGNTSRANLNLKISSVLKAGSFLTHQIYYSKNLFNLFSDFTFFMRDTIHGDEIKQWENRDLLGFKEIYNRNDSLHGTPITTEMGFTTRTDILNRGRDNVMHREFLSTGALGKVFITNYTFYVNENWQFYPKFTLNLGLRNDLFDFRLQDKLDQANSGNKWVFRFSPKLNLYYDWLPNVTLFAKTGIGFHSNFIQAVVHKGAADADPVPQSYGSDLGSNFKIGQNAIVSLAAWVLHVGSEYQFRSDDGSFENIGDARKYGVDLSVRYQFNKYLLSDVNLNFAKGILLGAPEGANLLPLHPVWNSTGGLTCKFENGLSGSLRYRYMGARPATEDGIVQAKSYCIVDAVVRYTRAKYELGASVENLLNRRWSEAQFYDQSRLRNESEPVYDFHTTPGTPFYFKGSISYLF